MNVIQHVVVDAYRVTHLVGKKTPVDLGLHQNLGCSTILLGQQVDTVAAHHLP